MMTPTFVIPELFCVKGLVALITGGGTGIGLMCARALAENGAKVYIVGRRNEVLEAAVEEFRKLGTTRECGGGAMVPIVGDTSEKETIVRIMKEMEGKEKWLDLLINNAGVSGPRCTVIDQDGDMEEAIKLFKINTLGYYYMSAAFLPMLNRSPNGSQIINITSNLNFGREPVAGVLYAMSKAATTHLTKLLATILEDTNVRCNEVAPGLFPSEMTAPLLDQRRLSNALQNSEHDGSERPSKWLKPNAARTMPFGTPDDIASTVFYLASKRQRYLSGSVVMLDGGMLNRMPSSY
ncbi:BZ3500_MvSof-1268-A1-R1_Chr6-3g08993 [Microbotryum saponariae]|uniref:BZ3500_MvSof-1268-A1-R1_Chr6-3g08993 protein n=1 Tax=Microbotryum saponariae TaxID=289078 RepID=A0A2X0ME99_9BASI|nr:BZ3500_MvSof-1268-A1-R1_Chr6-3g08993 [Microbotryum saponariae]SDA07595.1 BZ3501_MvSof-1269-A2-R1_Chr6-2g08697 [Microbotryum saponariae]